MDLAATLPPSLTWDSAATPLPPLARSHTSLTPPQPNLPYSGAPRMEAGGRRSPPRCDLARSPAPLLFSTVGVAAPRRAPLLCYAADMATRGARLLHYRRGEPASHLLHPRPTRLLRAPGDPCVHASRAISGQPGTKQARAWAVDAARGRAQHGTGEGSVGPGTKFTGPYRAWARAGVWRPEWTSIGQGCPFAQSSFTKKERLKNS